MRLWITKHVLAVGILVVEVSEADFVEKGKGTNISSKRPYVRIPYYKDPSVIEEIRSKDWFESRETAIIVAEAKRIKKIKEYEKQIEKLLNFDFTGFVDDGLAKSLREAEHKKLLRHLNRVKSFNFQSVKR